MIHFSYTLFRYLILLLYRVYGLYRSYIHLQLSRIFHSPAVYSSNSHLQSCFLVISTLYSLPFSYSLFNSTSIVPFLHIYLQFSICFSVLPHSVTTHFAFNRVKERANVPEQSVVDGNDQRILYTVFYRCTTPKKTGQRKEEERNDLITKLFLRVYPLLKKGLTYFIYWYTHTHTYRHVCCWVSCDRRVIRETKLWKENKPETNDTIWWRILKHYLMILYNNVFRLLIVSSCCPPIPSSPSLYRFLDLLHLPGNIS